ncbi:NmrA family NAD(P)-binding protein [Amycolatopsis sp. CA-230715]|uniref:NmrA family NAD(P)-binding protein n=1 Tax=Amycolatopsis sp. CA-230715 TaxID=2745196 RepID=UPI001C02F720|nr:NmrA family NAD(P)-binding protein [Amycolatopsis sp. CA-230715]QWF78807.1 hypothetical protein HUW46_02205 [Amycolatopsis sp. CA-230715]
MSPILVTGATGKQGGATARALLDAGFPVRALVRNPDTDRARAIAALGAELVTGNLRDRDSVLRAAEGVRAVFSIQMPELTDARGDDEWVQASTLIDAARDAGVGQFVHTSVSGAGQHRTALTDKTTSMWHSMETKAAIQDRVRETGFPQWTILKPGFFMENFLPPSFVLPNGPEGGLVTVIKPGTEVPLVAVADIGAAAAAAFADPARFHTVELELAGERLTMTGIAKILSTVYGTELTAPVLTTAEAIAAGAPDFGHDGLNEFDQPGRPEDARAFDIPLTGFARWANEHLR